MTGPVEPTDSYRDAAAALAALLDELPDGVPGAPIQELTPEEEAAEAVELAEVEQWNAGYRPGEVVDAEIVSEAPPDRPPLAGLPAPVEPSPKELVLRGRAALVETAHNPDDWVDPETEAELRAAIPENTLALMHWTLGAARWYCQERPGFAIREYMPMTVATLRNWIKDHWAMTRPDGTLRGRRGRPYSPNTVKTRVYLMAKIWKLKGYLSPTGHPKVQLQLRAYARKYEKAGFTSDEAHPISHAESVTLGRICPSHTVTGVRNRAAFRNQYDTGMRVSELLAMRIEDVTWSAPEWAGPGYTGPLNATIRIPKSKTDQDAKGRQVGVEYVPYLVDDNDEWVLDGDGKPVPHPDVDMDPAVLLAEQFAVLAEAGFTTGPVWRDTKVGRLRVDGGVSGEILDRVWTYDQFEAALKYYSKKAGIDVDPVTGEKRRITSHANRAGHITDALDGGEPVEKVAMRTGHSPTGSIHGYYRQKRRFGQANTGAQIRRRVVRRRVS